MKRTRDLIAQMNTALELDGGLYNIFDVQEALEEGQAQAFVSDTGSSILVTTLIDSNAGKTMTIWFAAGNMDEIVQLQRAACDAAKDWGCERAIFTGRRGWSRHPVPEAEGWSLDETKTVNFTKEL